MTPAVTLTIDNTGVNVANITGLVTFTFSESPVAFSLADTSAVGGTLSYLQQVNATTYTATFTGAPNTDTTNAAVSVIAGSWADGNGNAGAAGSTAPFTVDTATPTVTVSIGNTHINVTNPTGLVTFTFSEAPVAFSLADTSAVGGTLSYLQQVNATTYTATFTGAPNTDTTNAAVSVINGSYHDVNGNVGSGGSTISPVKFSSAVATFTEDTWAASKMIDGDFTGAQGNGWSVFNFATGRAQAADALLTLASPLPAGQYNLTFTIYQNYWNPGFILGDFALDYTTATSPTLSSPQIPVSIQNATSLHGTTFSLLSPGELLANTSQNSIGTDTYTISALVDSASPITGIFLDAITNPALPGGGPGRQYPNGNFVVSEFTLEAATGGSTGPFTVNTVTPAPVMLDAVKGKHLTTLSGTAEAASEVSIFDGTKLIGAKIAASDGTWSLQANVVGNVVHSFTEATTALAGDTVSSAGVTLYAPGGNKMLQGGTGNDVLIAGPNDKLAGGTGADTFVFNPRFGKDTITDFNVSQDILALDHRLFANATASQVLGQTHDSKAGAVIVVDAHDTITLTGVSVAQLQNHLSDFHFF